MSNAEAAGYGPSGSCWQLNQHILIEHCTVLLWCFRFYLAQPNSMHEGHHLTLVEEALGQKSARDYEGYLRRHSVQVPVK